MKKTILTLFITTIISFYSFSQSLPSTENVKLITKEDYRAADSIALQAAKFLLSTPSDSKNISRLKATQFLLKWMEGSPDYTFNLDGKVLKYFDKDLDLMGVYMASLSEFALQNKQVKDSKAITLNATKILIGYIDNTNDNVEMTSKLKKLSDANQKGELESFLNL